MRVILASLLLCLTSAALAPAQDGYGPPGIGGKEGVGGGKKEAKPDKKRVTRPVTPTPASGKAAPKIRIIAKDFDWGSVLKGTSITHVFKLVNDGNGPLRITKVRPSCGCALSKWTRGEIAPGASGEIELVVDTNKLPGGKHKKNATIYTNDRSAPNLQVYIGGEVLTVVKATPAPLKLTGLASEEKYAQIELTPGTDQTYEILSVTSRYKNVSLVDTTTVEPGRRYQLKLKAPAALPGIKPDSLEIVVRTADGKTHTTSVQTSVENQPRIQLLPGQGVVFRRQETAQLQKPGAPPLVKELTLRASREDIQFRIERAEFEGPHAGAFRAEVETVRPGQEFKIKVGLVSYQSSRFARAKLVIVTSDAMTPRREVRVFAQFDAKKPGS